MTFIRPAASNQPSMTSGWSILNINCDLCTWNLISFYRRIHESIDFKSYPANWCPSYCASSISIQFSRRLWAIRVLFQMMYQIFITTSRRFSSGKRTDAFSSRALHHGYRMIFIFQSWCNGFTTTFTLAVCFLKSIRYNNIDFFSPVPLLFKKYLNICSVLPSDFPFFLFCPTATFTWTMRIGRLYL